MKEKILRYPKYGEKHQLKKLTVSFQKVKARILPTICQQVKGNMNASEGPADKPLFLDYRSPALTETWILQSPPSFLLPIQQSQDFRKC